MENFIFCAVYLVIVKKLLHESRGEGMVANLLLLSIVSFNKMEITKLLYFLDWQFYRGKYFRMFDQFRGVIARNQRHKLGSLFWEKREK